MAEQIQVNKEVLSEQISKLTELNNSEELTNAIKALDGQISASSGPSAEILKNYMADFTALQTEMKLLFSRTLDFLQNKHGDFVVVDEQSNV